jgi:hypothetical protein
MVGGMAPNSCNYGREGRRLALILLLDSLAQGLGVLMSAC